MSHKDMLPFFLLYLFQLLTPLITKISNTYENIKCACHLKNLFSLPVDCIKAILCHFFNTHPISYES